MTITANRQVEYGGLRLDGSSGFEVQAIDGLAGYPDLRTADLPLLARHGLHPGTDLFGGRTVTLDVVIHSATQADFADAVRALRAAFTPGGAASPLSFQLEGVADDQPARVNARPRKLDLPLTSDWWAGYAEATVELFCPDPRIYSDAESSLNTTLPTSVAGLTWNLTWNLNWGGASTAGSIFAVNDGTIDAPATIRVDGPVTNPRVENLAAGKTLELDIVVATGDYLLIDSGARTVLLNGTASRYSSLTSDSEWFDLGPGSNEITFRASTTSAATLTVSWRSAWA